MPIKSVDLTAWSEIIEIIGDSAVDAVLRDVAEAARDRWIQLAGERLHSSQADYIRGIQPVSTEGRSVHVALVGALANMVENGASAWDLRDTLLGASVPVVTRGRGKKQNREGGFYRSIPFRHSIPGSSGRIGKVMGTGLDHYREGMAAEVGRKIHRAAKQLEPGQRLPKGILKSMTGIPHDVEPDIYAGMQRIAQPRGATYMTWRTISTSQPDGWIHPGIEARDLAMDVARDVDVIAENATKAMINNIIGGL